MKLLALNFCPSPLYPYNSRSGGYCENIIFEKRRVWKILYFEIVLVIKKCPILKMSKDRTVFMIANCGLLLYLGLLYYWLYFFRSRIYRVTSFRASATSFPLGFRGIHIYNRSFYALFDSRRVNLLLGWLNR